MMMIGNSDNGEDKYDSDGHDDDDNSDGDDTIIIYNLFINAIE
jgi:hypothetical protein